MSLPRVFVSRALPPEAVAPFQRRFELVAGPEDRPATRDELLAGVREADAFVPMLSDRVDAALLEGAPRLKIVANYAAGYNNIDLVAAASLGIWVTNTPDATTDATADLAMGLIIAAGRHFLESERFLREGRFDAWSPTRFLGLLLSGATLGIVGMGRIGKAVARRARAFGMRVVYHSRRRLVAEEESALEVTPLPLDELLGVSDVVSLHCPLTDQTRHLIDAGAIARMKPTALLVNTSRGPVVDEEALARALHEGRLGCAALDVYEQEPKLHPLLATAPRTLLLPHVGTSTLQTRVVMAEKALGDVSRVLEGKPPRFAVNAPVGPRSGG
ncbi:MAG: 2-hydroxyacid dehydrogenase [Myxococcales bacterium]|jgi:glyoxylate reductase